jgi:predicted DNA-binding protein
VGTKRNIANEPNIPLSLRISKQQHEALRDLASRQHRTVSQEMRVAIDAHILEMQREAA